MTDTLRLLPPVSSNKLKSIGKPHYQLSLTLKADGREREAI